jgi:tetratricopeptide (TPR) repeat protein
MSQHPAIFISYRRTETVGHARAFHLYLCQHFTSEAIYFDLQSIESGDKFPERLSKAVAKCRVLLALIGPDWLEVSNKAGVRRLDDPNDFVRQEISQALSLGKKVIPVLFGDTPPPSEEDLPGPLKRLAERNVHIMRGNVNEYKSQLAQLVRLVAKVPGVPKPLPDPSSGERYYRNLPQAPSIDPAVLEQAQQKLAQMPLDKVPDPCAPPEGSCLAFRSSRVFVGRQQDLMDLARLLKGGKTAAIGQIAAATGLGGIGKTQLASEFAHRYGRFFAAGVYWLNFADPQAIPAEVAACSSTAQAGFDLEAQVRQVLSAWQSALPRLLVFDNCEDQHLLEQWLPKAGASRVLVTSRRQTWDAALGVEMLQLGVLDRDDSIKLLCTLAAHLTQDEADAVAGELGDLPLALHMAGSFLNCYKDGVHPWEFLQQLQDKSLLSHDALKGRGTSFNPTQHELHVAKTFALSYGKLDPDRNIDRIALELLARTSWFAPGTPIPKALLLKTLDDEDNPIDPLDMMDGLTRLSDVGLIASEEQGDLVLHRLLALYVQGAPCNDDKARSSVETELLKEANRINNSGLPAGLIAWQPHLRFVTDWAMEREDETGANLCNTLGYHLYSIGDYQAARPYYENALEIRKKVLGDDHIETANSLNNIGGLLQVMGEYRSARPFFEKALKIRKQKLGELHPDTATILDNLGHLLQLMGDYQSARPYHENALNIFLRVLGEEDAQTAICMNNLGTLLYLISDYESALPYFEKALKINENVYDKEHPNIASSLNNLGRLLEVMGNYRSARLYYEKALEIRKKVLGEEHPVTAQSLNNLAMLSLNENKIEEATSYMHVALAISKKILGDDHPNTKKMMGNLEKIKQKLR